MITAVSGSLHIHDGLHIARLHLHEDGNTHLSINLFQFVDDSMFCQILHPYVNRCDDVGTIDGIQYRDVHILIQDLPAMHQTICATKNRVIRQFETILGTVLGTKHITNGALGQRSEGTTARIELFPMESAFVFRQREERQVLHLAEGVIINTFLPNRPVQGSDGSHFLTVDLSHDHLIMTFRQSGLELCSGTLGEYLVQTITQTVEFLHP